MEYKGRVYPAEAIGHDSLTNVSLIRLLKTPENFGIVPLALEQPLLPLGTFVVSLSCPLDFSVSPNLGIFTGVDKKLGDRIFPYGLLPNFYSYWFRAGGLSDLRSTRSVNWNDNCFHS